MFDTKTKKVFYTPQSDSPGVVLEFMPRAMLVREAAQEGQP